ncbi:MAG TPA: hypothetical protein VK465_11020 [Fibrobacteria bacterium]|nr:hypothetical protein [Fibrobacteria bacterium]
MKQIAAFLVLALVTFGMAKSKTETSIVVRVKSGGAAVYKTEQGEESDKLVDIGTGDEVTILKQGKGRSLIKTPGNVRGWVDNSTLEKVKISSGGSHNLKDVEVVGWLDNPSAVYILDNTNPDLNALPIDRNFNNEIVEKKDREEVERSYDEN